MKKEEKIISKILDVGEGLLNSGAEISRAENTMERLCKAYDFQNINVFTITSSIVITVTTEKGEILSQTRRVHGGRTDFTEFEMFNAISRDLCVNPRGPEYMEERISKAFHAPDYPESTYILIYMLSAATFCIFFGGDLLDAFASAVVAFFVYYLVDGCKKLEINFIVSNLLTSGIGGMIAWCLVEVGIGHHLDFIDIGNIMLLIPGIPFTNAIRDMINGDTISGLNRVCETVLMSVAIAVGFAVTYFL